MAVSTGSESGVGVIHSSSSPTGSNCNVPSVIARSPLQLDYNSTAAGIQRFYGKVFFKFSLRTKTHKDYVLDYTSPLKNVIMEHEIGNAGLTYRLISGCLPMVRLEYVSGRQFPNCPFAPQKPLLFLPQPSIRTDVIMNRNIIIISFFSILLLASCTVRYYPGPKIEKMKADIPELVDFIENNADSLDTLLQFQSQITEYGYFVSDRTVSVIRVEERHKEISRSHINLCDHFDGAIRETLRALTDAMSEVGNITIHPDELNLLLKKNETKDVGMYLSNRYTPFHGKTDVYCEQIDETWYAVLIFFPLG